MKVQNTRYKLLTLAATITVAILLALVNLGSQEGRALAAQDAGASEFRHSIYWWAARW